MFIALFFAYAFSLGYAYAAARSLRARRVLLARGTPARAGHHPVLRELARVPGRAEVHVLPAEAGRGLAQRAGASAGHSAG